MLLDNSDEEASSSSKRCKEIKESREYGDQLSKLNERIDPNPLLEVNVPSHNIRALKSKTPRDLDIWIRHEEVPRRLSASSQDPNDPMEVRRYAPHVDKSIYLNWGFFWGFIEMIFILFLSARPDGGSAILWWSLNQGCFLLLLLSFLTYMYLNYPQELIKTRTGYTFVYRNRLNRVNTTQEGKDFYHLVSPEGAMLSSGVTGIGFFAKLGVWGLGVGDCRGMLTSSRVPSVYVYGKGWRNNILFTPQNYEEFVKDYQLSFGIRVHELPHSMRATDVPDEEKDIRQSEETAPF